MVNIDSDLTDENPLDMERLKHLKLVIGGKLKDTEHYISMLGLRKVIVFIWLMNPLLPFSVKCYVLVLLA